ncbi:iron-containing alcohol dehydrogenase [Cupriavidus sp. 30B13]|uniref:iron-containing alcohol dehydrogenase n=1 Tax=Cupriavidus sp. 30B13 TaxID=3384241 RepID=UPI003B8FF280
MTQQPPPATAQDHDAEPVPFVYRNTLPARVSFAMPAGRAVLDEAERCGAGRVLVASGRSLARMADGPLQQVEHALGKRHAGTIATMRGHTPREDVLAIAEAMRRTRADLLVAVGGGSVIDGCKAALMCQWMDVRDVAAMDALLDPAAISPPANPVRLVSVSTTLSAAEFTAVAGVTEMTARAKQVFAHELLVARTAILDAAATRLTPMDLLLSTGMRSVDHAIEAFCSPRANPMTDFHALEGLRLLHDGLRAIRTHPGRSGPRAQAQLGMWQAISALSTGAGSGASHGIGYAIGATFDVAHGHTSCVMLPAVLRWNASVNEARQQRLSAAMGCPAVPADVLVAELVASLGLPGRLRDLGIGRGDFQEIARRSLGYAPVQANPRPIRREADVLEILELAL